MPDLEDVRLERPEELRRDVSHFSVRADLVHTGAQPDMANHVEGTFVNTEYLGTLETDVFEIAPGHYISVEQHRKLSDRERRMGEREIISWAADAGTLLEALG